MWASHSSGETDGAFGRAAPDARRHWFRAKWRAETAVRNSGITYTILRPSWVYGPEDNALNRFVRMARFLPFVPLIGSPAKVPTLFKGMRLESKITLRNGQVEEEMLASGLLLPSLTGKQGKAVLAALDGGYYDTPSWAWGVAVAGDYAYVVDGNAGLWVISVADPANPREVGYYDAPGPEELADREGDHPRLGQVVIDQVPIEGLVPLHLEGSDACHGATVARRRVPAHHRGGGRRVFPGLGHPGHPLPHAPDGLHGGW